VPPPPGDGPEDQPLVQDLRRGLRSDNPLDPADARVRIQNAIDTGAMVWPSVESDNWPQIRPLLEWLLRTMPEGGSGYDFERWSEAARWGLTHDFLESEDGAAIADDIRAELVEVLVAFGATHGVDEGARERLGEILKLLDGHAEQMLDVEHRTAERRLLHRLAVADPGLFRRGATLTAAAAIVWIIAKANESTSYYGPLTMQELLEPFGVSSVGQRARTFLAALGLADQVPNEIVLGSAESLVSDRRAVADRGAGRTS